MRISIAPRMRALGSLTQVVACYLSWRNPYRLPCENFRFVVGMGGGPAVAEPVVVGLLRKRCLRCAHAARQASSVKIGVACGFASRRT